MSTTSTPTSTGPGTNGQPDTRSLPRFSISVLPFAEGIEADPPTSNPEASADPEQLLEIEDIARRLQLPLSLVSLMVADGLLRYYLFPMGRVRFSWPKTLQDIQQFMRVGNPQAEVLAELSS
jgi:hypothetical protein